MKSFTIFLRDSDRKYIEDVAEAVDRHLNYVALRLIEAGIEAHKRGDFEI